MSIVPESVVSQISRKILGNICRNLETDNNTVSLSTAREYETRDTSNKAILSQKLHRNEIESGISVVLSRISRTNNAQVTQLYVISYDRAGSLMPKVLIHFENTLLTSPRISVAEVGD